MKINRLTDPIDIYSEWIDMGDAVNAPGGPGPSTGPRRDVEEDDSDDEGPSSRAI